jgi:fibronectin type 3 domain-containing protein
MLAGVLAVVPEAAADSSVAAPFDVSLVSVLPDGSGAFTSTGPAVTASEDGRYVAFTATGGGYTDQLFVRDRQGAGTTTLVSKDAAGDVSSAPIDAAAISRDGNAIAFLSSASLLPAVPLDGLEHVYVADWPSGAIRALPIPQTASNQAEALPPAGITISADGSKVAVVRVDDADSAQALTLFDTATATAAVLPGVARDVSYRFPQLSDDGSVVAYEVTDENDVTDVRVLTAAGAVIHEFDDIIAPFDAETATFALSGNGRLVSFVTYLHDAKTLAIERVDDSGSAVAVANGRTAGYPVLSGDGGAIGYTDGDDAIVASPPDSQAGTFLASALPDGSPADGASALDALARNGLDAVFSSAATAWGGPGDGSLQVYYAASNDTSGPTWSADAELSYATPGYFSVDLIWPDAVDDVGVTAYEVFADGSRVATVDGFDTDYTVSGLQAGTTHTFAVRALDFAGRESPQLTMSASTMPVTRQQVIDTVSVLPGGGAAPQTSANPSVSSTGRYVAFAAESECSGAEGYSGGADGALASSAPASPCYPDLQAFARDRQAGTTTLLSHLPDGSVPTDGHVSDVAISGDGSEVAFVSSSDGLVAGDDDGSANIFVADRATGAVHAVPIPDTDVPFLDVADGHGIAIDADGTHVAYVIDGDNAAGLRLVVSDWRAGTATVVPLPAGTYSVDEPELSADGGRLAFVASVPDSQSRVVVVDVADPSAPLLSRVTGDPYYYAYDGGLEPRITLSGDGSHLAYPVAEADAPARLEIQDLTALNAPPVVVANPNGDCDPQQDACYDVGGPALSADGSTVVFDPMNSEGSHFLYRANPVTSPATPVATLPDGTLDAEYPGDRTPAVTADGTGVVFQSNNPKLAALTTGSDIVYEHGPNAVAPSFASDAALTADNVTGTQARLSWPAATDDHVVIGYRVTRDGVTVADLDPTATSFTATGLAAGSTYHFAVSGVDAALNVGTPVVLAVTTSGGTQPPGQAALAVDASVGGGHATLTWDPSSDPNVTGYRVLRGTGDTGALTAIADVDGQASTTYADADLAASTTYRYEVHTLGSDGERNYTVTAKVVTPAMSAATASMSVPLVDGARVAKLGSDLAIVAHGGANLTAVATVAYTNIDGSTATADVALPQTADDSGVYTGKFSLAEGISAITGVGVALTDTGANTVNASAAGLPLGVSGALRVTVEAPPNGSVDGAKLSALSDNADTGAQQTVNGGQTVTLPLAASSDYTLTLTEPATYTAMPGYQVLRQSGIAITTGTVSTVTLEPALPAFLSVRTLQSFESQVDVYDADGNLVGTKSGGDAAAADAFGPVPAGTQVRVESTMLDETAEVAKHVSQTVTLAPGENQVTVNHSALPTAIVSGTLTVSGAPPDWGGRLTATETVDGRAWTFHGTPKADGSYSMTVLAGAVTVTANANQAVPDSKTVTLAAGATGNADFDLVGPRQYRLALGLTTVEPDGTIATLPVDWRTAVHFRVRVYGTRGGSSFSAGSLSPTIIVEGLPGDIYTMCADGAEAGLPAACDTVTLGTESSVDLAVTLTGAGRITGTLLGADGQPFAGHWNAYVYQLLDGQRRNIDYALGSGSGLSTDVPSSGSYEIDIFADGGLTAQPVTTTVSGGVVNVGQIPLARNSVFSAAGNTVVAQSSQVTPGQVAEFRATYAYNGGPTTATLRLGVPAGTSLVPGSVTLNGESVADPVVSGGFAELPLSSLPTGATGVVHYAVATTASTPAGPLTTIVRIAYGATGNDLIGSATTTVIGVTLAAPSQIKGLTAALTGHAPAGTTVSVYDEFGQLVGSAIAGEGGLWSMSATLPDHGEGYHYTLQAVTTVGGVTVRSDTQGITHNSHAALPTTLSVSQPDGRVVSFNPSTGVARFPYVFVPGYGLNVAACFPSGTTVSSISARIGPQLGGVSGVGVLHGSASLSARANDAAPRSNATLISATQPQPVNSAALVGGSGSGSCYTAQLNPSVSQLGAIYLDYTANPAPFAASDLQPVGDPRESLPSVVAGYSGGVLTDDGNGGSSYSADLPGGGAVSFSTTSRSIAYTPTSADLAAAAGSGVPIYGLNNDVSVSTDASGVDTISGTTSFVVPSSWLPAVGSAAGGAVSTGVASSNLVVRAAALDGAIDGVVVTAKWLMKGKSLYGALKSGGPYDKLSQLLDQVENGCANPVIVQSLSDFLSKTADDIALLQATKAGIMLAGAVGGFALFGPIGSAVLGGALGMAVDWGIDKELESAKKQVDYELGSLICRPEYNVPIADPDWVIDPSGFTYEAVTSNRLAGVTATLLRASNPDGPFTVWDAAAYGQDNPLVTDNDGSYGWNVPFGYWKVAYTKAGYETAYSQVFQIPPPRFDVNVGLTRIAAPTVTLTRATSGAASSVTVGFDDYLKVDTVSGRVTVVDGDGISVSGSVQPVDAQNAPDGTSLATTFRFVPDQPFTDGEALTVNVGELVRDYAGHTLDADFSASLTASAPTTPGAANNVRAFATDSHTVVVKWTSPADDGGSPLTGFRVSEGSQSVDVAADARSATFNRLDPMTTYNVAVAAVNAVGAGSAQSVVVTTPPLSADEAFGSFHVSPTIDGGATGQGSVSLPVPASSDTIFALSSDSDVASVPHSVTVPTGQTSATFDVTTLNPVVDTDVAVSASRGGVSVDVPTTVDHVDVALQATPSASGVALSWSAASDADVAGYRVMRAVGDGSFSAVADVDASTTSYTDTTASAGSAYHYRVFAVLPNDNAQPWSTVADANTPLRSVTLSVTTSPSAPVEGADVTVNVAAAPADEGAAVTVTEGATTLGSGLLGADGTVAIVLHGLAVGTHQLTVAYAGGATTAPASALATVAISPAQHQAVATKLTVDPLRSLFDLLALAFGKYRVTAHLTRADNGAPIAGQPVVIDSWRGDFCTTVTDSNGVASCPAPQQQIGIVLLGQVHASYAGSADYLPSEYGSDTGPGRGHVRW